MKSVIRLMAVVCCTLACLHAGPAQAERRLALAVGIDVYDNLPAHEQLKKAVNDARAAAAALRELGFEATVEENLPRLAFARTWQRFLNRLEPGDTAALFFAGHGVEIGGLNYLLPRDVPKVEMREDRLLADASIRFNSLMEDLRDKKVRVALFIVDACRDNPFRDGRGRSVGGTRGLIRVEPAKGSFVMYSAGAGERALDRLSDADKDGNSPYTRTLLPILKTPGLSLPEIATRVRREVVQLARTAQPPHEQTPAYYDELVGDFVLKAGFAADPRLVVVPSPMPLNAADRMWAAVKDTTSIPALEVAWLSRKTGKTYRLLSEAEWEFAARADTTTRYAFGDTITKSKAQYWARSTVEVGLFPANNFGMHDMHGNAWEWCEDNWHPDYKGAPIDGSAWRGGDGSLRVLRGGSWFYDLSPDELRSAGRGKDSPGNHNGRIGFRLARTLLDGAPVARPAKLAPPPVSPPKKASNKVRPDAVGYSLKIWSYGSLPIGHTASSDTPYGTLTCTIMGPATRQCHW